MTNLIYFPSLLLDGILDIPRVRNFIEKFHCVSFDHRTPRSTLLRGSAKNLLRNEMKRENNARRDKCESSSFICYQVFAEEYAFINNTTHFP